MGAYRERMAISRAAACALPTVSRTRLNTMLRDGLLTSLDLDEVLHAREQKWITIREAAAILGVNTTRVGQLVDAGRLPCHQAARPRARRWFRTTQVEGIANARQARRWATQASRP
jgi:excisionase family DNA binding protein